MNDIYEQMHDIYEQLEQEQEAYWNSLSKHEQLKAFCAVVRRIYKADLEDKGSYRYALYNVFGFGPEAYGQAQLAGYLALHNSIYDYEQEPELLEKFARYVGADVGEVSNFLREVRW